MRRHSRLLRALLVLVAVVVACSIVSQVVYGPWLRRTADALVLRSPVISYRYPGVYEGSARVGHVAAKVRVTLGSQAVSYTHLRAHETRHDLVCRLLLEKKKKKKTE